MIGGSSVIVVCIWNKRIIYLNASMIYVLIIGSHLETFMVEKIDAMNTNELVNYLRLTYPKETCYGCCHWVYRTDIDWHVCDVTGGGINDYEWLLVNLKYDECRCYEKFVY